MWKFFLFGLLMVAQLSEAHLCATDPNYVVRLTQVIHRHGARSPLPGVNETLICGSEYPCGYLNNVGMSMLRAVGAYVRKRYNDLSIVEEPFFPAKQYNASLVYSRSTAKERTIQSSSAFLSGIFPELSLPVPYTVDLERDTLLNPDIYPSVITRELDEESKRKMLNRIVDMFFSWEQLKELADEASIAGRCLNYSDRYECALKLYDIAAAYKQVGKLNDKRKLKDSLLSMETVYAVYFAYLFYYDSSNEIDRKQGTVAYKLAEEIVKNMYSHVSSPSYRMYEYSTHDSMLASLGITLGDDLEMAMKLPFAQTYIIELLENVSDKTFHVRILRGSPQRNETEQGGEFSFVETGVQWRCMASNNSVYVPIDNTCPLEDFYRYIRRAEPAAPNGFCVIPKHLYEKLKCPGSGEDGLPLTPACKQYRTVCPKVACGKGFVLSAADLQCYPLMKSDSGSRRVSPAKPAYEF